MELVVYLSMWGVVFFGKLLLFRKFNKSKSTDLFRLQNKRLTSALIMIYTLEGSLYLGITNKIVNLNFQIISHDWSYYIIMISIGTFLYIVNNFIIRSINLKGQNILSVIEKSPGIKWFTELNK